MDADRRDGAVCTLALEGRARGRTVKRLASVDLITLADWNGGSFGRSNSCRSCAARERHASAELLRANPSATTLEIAARRAQSPRRPVGYTALNSLRLESGIRVRLRLRR